MSFFDYPNVIAARRSMLIRSGAVLSGAAIALLFAPATGEETREYLGQRAREGREKVVDTARQFRTAAEGEA